MFLFLLINLGDLCALLDNWCNISLISPWADIATLPIEDLNEVIFRQGYNEEQVSKHL